MLKNIIFVLLDYKILFFLFFVFNLVLFYVVEVTKNN